MLTEVIGTVFLITGYAILPTDLSRMALYSVMIGSILGILMSARRGSNRVDIILEENNLRRVKAKDLQKTKMKIRDITKYGDILGFDLVAGADQGHTYKWVDRYGDPTVLTSTHDPQKKAWLIYKDLAEKGKYGLSRGDLYQIVHWQKRIKKKYTE